LPNITEESNKSNHLNKNSSKLDNSEDKSTKVVFNKNSFKLDNSEDQSTKVVKIDIGFKLKALAKSSMANNIKVKLGHLDNQVIED